MASQKPVFRCFSRDLLILDVETTGPDPLIHEAVSIGAVLLDKSTLEARAQLQTLIRPEHFNLAEPAALAIHGISWDRLQSAPAADVVAREYVQRFGLAYTLGGWNVGFDAQFVAQIFKNAGMSAEFRLLDYHRFDLWSVMQFAWICGVLEKQPESLSTVCEMFGLARPAKHDALEDALISAEVLRKTLRLFEEIGNEKRVRMGRFVTPHPL